MVVALGVTLTDVPDKLPGIQEYVLAPDPVIVDVPPLHIIDGKAVAVTAGIGLTVTSTVAVPEHPEIVVPVTEYVVVELGVTLMMVPDKLPGIHE